MTLSTLNVDELRLLADSARDVAADAADFALHRQLRGSVPGYAEPAWPRAVALGWTAMTVPERCGGAGLGLRPAGTVLQALGAWLQAEPLVEQAWVPAAVLSALPAGEGVDGLLQGIAQGHTQGALAWLDQHVPDPVVAWQVQAVSAGAQCLLSGRKHFAAPARDGWLVSATHAGRPGLFWVRRDAAGLDVAFDARVDGVACATLTLDRTPATCQLAEGDAAVQALQQGVDAGALLACAELLGVMATALDTTLDYVRTRVQFGQPVGAFQAVQHRLVELYIEREMAISSYASALDTLEGPAGASERAQAVSQAKARCTEAALHVTQGAVQYHGAMGYTDDCNIGLYLKRALVLAQAWGNAAFHRERFARLVRGASAHPAA